MRQAYLPEGVYCTELPDAYATWAEALAAAMLAPAWEDSEPHIIYYGPVVTWNPLRFRKEFLMEQVEAERRQHPVGG